MLSKYNALSITVIFIAIISIPITVFAEQKYVVGVQNLNYFPHYDYNDKEANSLIEVLLQDFAKKENIKIKTISLPTKRLEKAFFDTGEIDVIYPANPKWYADREKNTLYSAKLVSAIGGTMALHKNRNIELEEFKALAVPFGFKPVEWLALLDANTVKAIYVPDAESALKLVLSGRVTGADVELNVANHFLSQWGIENQLVLAPALPWKVVDFHIATINSADFIQQLNEYLITYAKEVTQMKSDLGIIEQVQE